MAAARPVVLRTAPAMKADSRQPTANGFLLFAFLFHCRL
jgi:hypothetical protein